MPSGAPPKMKMDYRWAPGSSTCPQKRIESEREPGQVTQVEQLASAPSLKRKLTGEIWSHHQMSRSDEQHAEEVLCSWSPPWAWLPWKCHAEAE
jgi:hypothetical protein